MRFSSKGLSGDDSQRDGVKFKIGAFILEEETDPCYDWMVCFFWDGWMTGEKFFSLPFNPDEGVS